MRQHVKIVGIDKKRIQGEKNGFQYDFLKHHSVFLDAGVTGFRTESFTVSREESAEFGDFVVGKTYDIVFHFGKNGRMIIDTVLGLVEDK